MRDDIKQRENSSKRLETEIHSLKHMFDTQALNESRMWVSESKIKYDFGKVSNPKDSERILSMTDQVEELLKINKEKDEKIKMLKSKADMMSRSMKENCVKIEELDSEHKKQGFTIDDLQRKLNVVKKKIQRLDEFKRNESDF